MPEHVPKQPLRVLCGRVNVDRAVSDLNRVTHHKSLLPGDKLFGLEDPSMELFLIESGSINLRVSREWQPVSVLGAAHWHTAQ